MFGCIDMFTDLPHPNDPRQKQIWRLNPWPGLTTVANELVNREEERHVEET